MPDAAAVNGAHPTAAAPHQRIRGGWRASEIQRVSCHAQAPNSERASAANGLCNNILGDLPGPLKFVGLRARRPDRPDGRVWVICGRRDCRTWNVFELSSSEEAASE